MGLTCWRGISRRTEGQHLEVEHFLGGGIQQLPNLPAAAAKWKNANNGRSWAWSHMCEHL